METKNKVMDNLQKTKEYQKFVEIINEIPEEYDEFKQRLLQYYFEIALPKYTYSYRSFETFSKSIYRSLKCII